jgi:hypothetical protein
MLHMCSEEAGDIPIHSSEKITPANVVPMEVVQPVNDLSDQVIVASAKPKYRLVQLCVFLVSIRYYHSVHQEVNEIYICMSFSYQGFLTAFKFYHLYEF